MTPPLPTAHVPLSEQIAAAERAGDYRTARTLKAQWQAMNEAASDHNGNITGADAERVATVVHGAAHVRAARIAAAIPAPPPLPASERRLRDGEQPAQAVARLLRAEAQRRNVDPDAAEALGDAGQVIVAGDGTISGADDAVIALLNARPYLARSASPSTFDPNDPTPDELTDPGPGEGGHRGSGLPLSLDEEIAAAEKAGDWPAARHLKAKRLVQQAQDAAMARGEF